MRLQNLRLARGHYLGVLRWLGGGMAHRRYYWRFTRIMHVLSNRTMRQRQLLLATNSDLDFCNLLRR